MNHVITAIILFVISILFAILFIVFMESNKKPLETTNANNQASVSWIESCGKGCTNNVSVQTSTTDK